MTLIPFPPENLDRLALRLLDLAGSVRRMAERSRESGVPEVPLHGNKIQEWLIRVEEWTHDAQSRLEGEINRERGARRARELLAPPIDEVVRKSKRSSTVRRTVR